jgi:hypothetical protein
VAEDADEGAAEEDRMKSASPGPFLTSSANVDAALRPGGILASTNGPPVARGSGFPRNHHRSIKFGLQFNSDLWYEMECVLRAGYGRDKRRDGPHLSCSAPSRNLIFVEFFV